MIRLRYLTISVIAVLVAVSTIPLVLSYEYSDTDFTVPSWIKNNAGWWADDQINDDSFVSGIQWMIKNDVIMLPPTEQGTGDGENVIPNWIKTNAGWWADDKISDTTFVGALRYLINEGIMVVEQVEQSAESAECTFKNTGVVSVPCETEVVEIKDFYMDVNANNCCSNWAFTEDDYRFQIETFNEKRGNYIDGINLDVKILSKDGELRAHITDVITNDGIYLGEVTVPDIWFGDNILSVTGEYNGIGKTIEREFTVFKSSSGTGHSSGTFQSSFFSPTNATSDGLNSFTELNGAHSVDTFTIDSKTYAIVTAQADDGVQIIDITGPMKATAGFATSGILAKDAETDGSNSFTELEGPRNVATYTITSATASDLSLSSTNYAIVAGAKDNGLQVIDIGIPTAIVAKDSETDNANGFDELNGAYGIATFSIPSNSTYRGAIVTASAAGSVMSVDITNPTAIVEKDVETDGNNSFDELSQPRGVATFQNGLVDDNRYAIVVSESDDGVQIIDITNPAAIVAKDSETDGANGFTELDGAHGVATFTLSKVRDVNDIDGDDNLSELITPTYAIVASVEDDGVQIIDISNPAVILALDAETDGVNGFDELDGAAGVSTFTCGNRTYAIVASNIDDGIQLIDISVPTNIVALESQTDGANGFTELDGARNVVTFTANGTTYAIVTAQTDDGVQIVEPSCTRY